MRKRQLKAWNFWNKNKNFMVIAYTTVLSIMAVGLVLLVVAPLLWIWQCETLAGRIGLTGGSLFILTAIALMILFTLIEKTTDSLNKI